MPVVSMLMSSSGAKSGARRPREVDDAPPVRVRKQADQMSVRRSQREADRDRFAVPQLVVGELLELVRRPVAEVERPRGAELERVAAGGDVLQVQLGAAIDDPRIAAISARQARLRALRGKEERASLSSATLIASEIPARHSRSVSVSGT